MSGRRLVDPGTMSHPAGLSTDSFELNPAPVSPPSAHDDQWSDAHDTVETDGERDAIEEVEENADEDLTVVQAPKLDTDKTETHEIDTPSPTTNLNHTLQERSSEADATSVHSMPIVQVTEPTSPTLPATPHSVHSHRSSTTAPSHNSLAAPGSSNNDRRRRYRNTLDVSAVYCHMYGTV